MYSDECTSDFSEAEKRRATGKCILNMIAVVKVCFALIVLMTTDNLVLFLLSLVFTVALSSGVNWIRWVYVVGGLIGNILALFAYLPRLSPGTPEHILALLSALILADIVTLVVLAVNSKVNEFILYKQPGYPGYHSYRGSKHQSSAQENEKKEPCPVCGKEIVKAQRLCPLCGGDIIEKEAENNRLRREKLEQDGYGSVLARLIAMHDIKEIRRIYGSKCCISYLKDKALELGMTGLEITADDLDGLLSVG